MKYWCLDLSEKEKYAVVLPYVLEKCDEVSFHFPILDKDKDGIGEFAEAYEKYERAKREFLEELFKNGAKRAIGKIYQDIRLGYETQIIKVKLYPALKKRIQKHHLYDWLWWNSLPEDLCFFSKGTRRFLTISHEEIFYVFDRKADSLLFEL